MVASLLCGKHGRAIGQDLVGLGINKLWMNIMSNYYQLSTDYDLAADLLHKKNRLPVYLTDENGDVGLYTMWVNEDLEILVNDQVEVFAIADLECYLKKNNAQFFLPISDPTIEISNPKDQIDGRDAALRGSAKIIQGLNQETELLIRNNKAFAQENERLLTVLEERYKKIDILQDNLDRSDSDRLSELTSIMRMVQAWESVPIQQGLGAIHLIKRVIYDAICKLDPSQAVDP